MGEPSFDGSCRMTELEIEGLVEMVTRAGRCWKLVEDRIDGAGACVYFGGMLGGDVVCVEGVSFAASERPDVEEVGPQVMDQFLGPGGACVGLGPFPVAVVFLLVIEERLGDASLEKVLSTDGLLLT